MKWPDTPAKWFMSLMIAVSLIIMLISGTFIQHYTTSSESEGCQNCVIEMSYFFNTYLSWSSLWMIIPSLACLITCFTARTRINNFFWLTGVTWIALFATDLLLSFVESYPLDKTFLLTNLVYDLLGSLALAIWLTLCISAVRLLTVKKSVSLWLAGMVPLITSIITAILVCVFLLLFFSHDPAYIEAQAGRNLKMAYSGSDDGNSFGLLTDSVTRRPVHLKALKNMSLQYVTPDKFEVSVFGFSSCRLEPESFTEISQIIDGIDSRVIIADKLDLQIPYFTQATFLADLLNIKSPSPSLLEINRNSGSITAESTLLNKQISITPVSGSALIVLNVIPAVNNHFMDIYNYPVRINGKEINVINSLEREYNKVSGSKRGCRVSGLSVSSDALHIGGVLESGLIIKIKPYDYVPVVDNPPVIVSSPSMIVYRNYEESQNPYADISNGEARYLQIQGVESLNINNNKENVTPDTVVFVSGKKLSAFVSKENNVKVTGLADLIQSDGKVMNLRKITALGNILSPISGTVSEIIKLLLGVATAYLTLKSFGKYMLSDVKESVF